MSYTHLYHWRLVQPRLVENRVYAYKACPQTVEDKLDRKDTRLFPSCQCLFHSHGAVSPANVCVLFPHRQPHLSGGHGSFPVVRKEITPKITAAIGSTTNPIPYKGGEMSKQSVREGPMGKEKPSARKPTTLSGSLSGKRSETLSCLRL